MSERRGFQILRTDLRCPKNCDGRIIEKRGHFGKAEYTVRPMQDSSAASSKNAVIGISACLEKPIRIDDMPRHHRPPKPKTAHPINIYACLDGDLSSLEPAKASKSPRKAPTRHVSGVGNGRVAGGHGKRLKQQNLIETGMPRSVDHEG